MRQNPGVPPPGWQLPQQQQQQQQQNYGVPPPGAWGRRQEGGRSAPAPDLGGGYLEGRDAQRKASTFSIWPASPTSPYHSSDEEDRRKRKSSSKHKGSSKKHSHRSHKADKYSSGEDSEEEERKRRRRRRKEREREDEKRDHHSRSHRHRHRDHDDESDREHKDSKRGKSEERDSHSRSKKSPERSTTLDVVTAPEDLIQMVDVSVEDNGKGEVATKKLVRIGPQLPLQVAASDEADVEVRNGGVDQRAYGKALLPGEGSAMANFVQEGKRIPRRGEIGLSSDQIEGFEKQGYVMSGSRHQRMNAVRMRKENQIISAEEQRSILKMRAEEKQKKETEIVAQFKDMIESMGD
ncbi:hypothetical protein CBS101457_003736 [Exobasidium rhododendri]|nr:hypothetical protein CBS101457_003736 [Exobasidium rhododendri]